jgi:hypothetical protein
MYEFYIKYISIYKTISIPVDLSIAIPVEIHAYVADTKKLELPDVISSAAKEVILNIMEYLNDNLSDEIKEKINNIIGGNVFLIE